MPVIASKIVVGGLAAATALSSAVGGYFAKDDISQTAVIASDYIEAKIERHFEEAAQNELAALHSKRFSAQGGNP